MFNRIYIEITNVCNLNCDFCPHTNRKKKFMSVDEFALIMEKIKGYTSYIYLHVKGEPLIHHELDKILKIANSYNLNVNITTNARILKDKLDIIINNKIRQLNISLHSFDSLDEIEEILYVIDKISDSYISLRLWNNKDNSDILKLLERHYNKNITNDKRFTLGDNVFLDRDVLFSWPDINIDEISKYGTCKGGKNQLAILVDGTLVPCCLDNDGYNKLGNIFESDLESVLKSNNYRKIVNGFNNNILVSELCKRCGYIKRFKGGM